MKKIISFIISLSLIFSAIPYHSFAVDNDGTLKWPEKEEYGPNDNFSDKLRVRFRPLNNYTCDQNPPDFSWRPIPKATKYELVVAKDKELNNIVEHLETENPFYNFTKSFEPGIYYWTVRYFLGKEKSEFSEVRRFRIDESADIVEFETPEEMSNRVLNMKRPIAYNFTKEQIDNLKNTKDGKKFYESNKSKVEEYLVKKPDINTAKTYKYGEGGTAMRNLFWQEVQKGWDVVDISSIMYGIDKDTRYASLGKEYLMKLSEFKYPPFDANTDSYISKTFVIMSKGYDTFYDFLNEDERYTVEKTVSNLVSMCMKKLYPERGHSVWETNPSASHEWGVGARLIITHALMKDKLPTYKEVITFLLPLYANLMTAHSIEDGSYQQGTGYLRYSDHSRDVSFPRMGIFDFYKKTTMKNAVNQYLYMYPVGSIGGFGDESYQPSDYYCATDLDYFARIYKDPVAAWMRDENGQSPLLQLERALLPQQDFEAKAPIDYPRSKYFKDNGFVGLHSDLIDKNRVSLLFRSSWWGSMGHCHPDQNAFIIQAYGEPLAIDSGFYPWMGSPHHANYATKTYAHNAITLNGGKGQFNADIDSEGKITAYLNQADFDLVSGDATKAYKTGKHDCPPTLSKAKRDIIYIRPDNFIVIDDLKSLPGEKSSFEFWLNAEEDLKLYNDVNGCKITKGDAVLDAKMFYPTDVTVRYLDKFMGPDLINHPKEIDGDTIGKTPDPNQRNQKRAYFATKPTAETKMVTVLDVHKKSYPAEYVKEEKKGNTLRLSFEDGTKAYIKLNNDEKASMDNIEFMGNAVVTNGDTIMLVNGTQLVKDGEEIISSDVPVSVVYGKNELSISAIENDAKVKVKGNIKKVLDLRKKEGRDIPLNTEKCGVLWEKDGEYDVFKLYNDAYTFYLNDKTLPGTSVSGLTLNLVVDGKEMKIPAEGYIDHDSNIKGTAKIKNMGGTYSVSLKDGANVSPSYGLISLTNDAVIQITKDNSKLSLKTVKEEETSSDDDYNGLKNKVNIFKEAEDFTEKKGIATVQNEAVYSFLSQGKMLQNIQGTGNVATYDIEVKEDGLYELMLSNVVYNATEPAKLSIKIGDEVVVGILPVTNGPNGPNVKRGTSVWGVSPKDWHVSIFKQPLNLKKGKYQMQLIGLGGGNTKIDWIGLMKK